MFEVGFFIFFSIIDNHMLSFSYWLHYSSVFFDAIANDVGANTFPLSL